MQTRVAMFMIKNRHRDASVTATRLPEWPMRWMLRRSGLPDLPEVRRVMRIAWQRGFTLRAAPSKQKMRAIREQALSALSRALQVRNGATDANQTSANPCGAGSVMRLEFLASVACY